jgi:hypothetical protein
MRLNIGRPLSHGGIYLELKKRTIAVSHQSAAGIRPVKGLNRDVHHSLGGEATPLSEDI